MVMRLLLREVLEDTNFPETYHSCSRIGKITVDMKR